jgi:hypothetical protein
LRSPSGSRCGGTGYARLVELEPIDVGETLVAGPQSRASSAAGAIKQSLGKDDIDPRRMRCMTEPYELGSAADGYPVRIRARGR